MQPCDGPTGRSLEADFKYHSRLDAAYRAEFFDRGSADGLVDLRDFEVGQAGIRLGKRYQLAFARVLSIHTAKV